MAIITELGFSLQAPPIAGPVVTSRDVSILAKVLQDAGDWMTAAQIRDYTGDNDRKIRAIASTACPQIISYPGSPGYKIMAACTIEEIDRCINALHSQGQEMLKRANLITRAYHRRGH